RQVYADLSDKIKGMLVVEMNAGQMLEDVLAANRYRTPTEFFARLGGVVPFPDEVLSEIHRMVETPISTDGHPRDRWLARVLAKG
ncbi:MAG: 3-methyl-2-oxobutanoate dehydrogenase subunit beta, partial [Anaerolineaceae bacterium]|nr:3-methyl-2-oxobutanoate dehydrogenase subunit beta [Anaerolineaceae bacterium]